MEIPCGTRAEGVFNSRRPIIAKSTSLIKEAEPVCPYINQHTYRNIVRKSSGRSPVAHNGRGNPTTGIMRESCLRSQKKYTQNMR